MRKARQDNRASFIVVYEFMMNELCLSGVPLLLYARIFGFCAGGHDFYESKGGTARLLGTTPRTVFRARLVLLEQGLIVEHPGTSRTASKLYGIRVERLPEHVRRNLSAYGWDSCDNASYDNASYDAPASTRPSPYGDSSSAPMTICHPITKMDNKGFDTKGGR